MNFEIPASMTVSVRKTARIISGINEWPLVSIEKVFAYGLQQLSNDAVASGETPEEIEALFLKRIDNLSEGVLRAPPIRGSADPVAREATRIARDRVLAALKAKGISPKGANVADLAVKLIAKNPSIMDVAKANVAMTADLEVEVDLPSFDEDEEEADED